MKNESIDLNTEIEILREKFYQSFDITFLENTEKTIEVTCEDTAKHALSMALQSRKLEKTLDNSRLELTRPHVNFQRTVNKLVQDMQRKLQEMEDRLHKKIDDWREKNNDNPFLAVDELVVEDGSLYKKDEWKFDIENEEEIPRDYLIVDPVQISNAIKNGVRNIPGIKIQKQEKTFLRVKN